jgi:hypothetical protein
MHSKMVLTIAYKSRVKNEKLTAKHVVEEAMTEAYVRKCNNCNKVFLKEGGCNRIKCQCGNLQCYVCELNVADYSHFDNPGSGKLCPLYGELHLKEQVAEAQERTVRELLKNRAELQDDDIRVDKVVGTDVNLEAPRSLFAHLAVPNVFLPWTPPPVRRVQNRHNPQHTCFQCDKSFGLASSLSQHQTAKGHHHLSCEWCDKDFGAPYSRAQHMRDKHGV